MHHLSVGVRRDLAIAPISADQEILSGTSPKVAPADGPHHRAKARDETTRENPKTDLGLSPVVRPPTCVFAGTPPTPHIQSVPGFDAGVIEARHRNAAVHQKNPDPLMLLELMMIAVCLDSIAWMARIGNPPPQDPLLSVERTAGGGEEERAATRA